MQKNKPDRRPRTARGIALAAKHAAQHAPPRGEDDDAFERRAVLGAAAAEPAADDPQGQPAEEPAPAAAPSAVLPPPAAPQAPVMTPASGRAGRLPRMTMEIRNDDPPDPKAATDLFFRPSERPLNQSSVAQLLAQPRPDTARGAAFGEGGIAREDASTAGDLSSSFGPPVRSAGAGFSAAQPMPLSPDAGFVRTAPLPFSADRPSFGAPPAPPLTEQEYFGARPQKLLAEPDRFRAASQRSSTRLLADRTSDDRPDATPTTDAAPPWTAKDSPEEQSRPSDRPTAPTSAAGIDRSAEGSRSRGLRIFNGVKATGADSVANNRGDKAQRREIHFEIKDVPEYSRTFKQFRGLLKELETAMTDRIDSAVRRGTATQAASARAAYRG